MLPVNTLLYIIACVLSCVQMAVYIHFKLKGKGKAYTVSKCAGSFLFIAVAAAGLFFGLNDLYEHLILVAMLLSLVGDYFLAQPIGHNRIKLGAVSFASAHICFIISFLVVNGFMWQTLPVIAALLLLELGFAKLTKLRLRGMGKGVTAYCSAVTSMAVCAAALLFGDMPTVPAVMTAVGGALFLASDCLWFYYGFLRGSAHPLLKALNVLTYFPAQMLIAGALLYR